MLSNALLASSASDAFYALELQRLKQADAQARMNLRRAQAAASDATVTRNVTYTIGPDGVRYATGSTVSTVKRGVESGAASTLDPQRLDRAARKPLANENAPQRGFADTRPATLAELLANKLSLSPLEFALAFSEPFTDGIARAELQIADRAVRSQETLHFRAAGGLASGTPVYGMQAGPDGALYATSGHVNIQTPSTTDPRKAARNAATLGIAATAPGDASAQDIGVARNAFSRAAGLYQQQALPLDERSVNIIG